MAKINTQHFGIQRKIVAAMTTESWREIPHVTYMYEPDVTEFYDYFRNKCKERGVTFNTLMLRTIIEGLKASPKMNSHIDYDRHYVKGKITTYEKISISMPMILPNGEMMTVNLHGFHKKSLNEMASYIEDVKKRANYTNLNEAMYDVSINNTLDALKSGEVVTALRRILGAKVGSHKVHTLKGDKKKEYESIPQTDRLTRYDLEPGTVTVSNVGSLYIQQKGAISLLEIVPPQVTAIALSSVQDKPLVITNDKGEKEIAIRKVLPICIAFDHRALDFGDIIPFLKRLDEVFANPEVIENWY